MRTNDRNSSVDKIMAGMMGRAPVLLSIILASLLKSMHGETNADDVQGLRLFFSSLSSPPLLTGWNDTGDPCMDSWKGVTCDDDGDNVTQIELSGLILNGTLGWSSSLSGLQNLRVLDLSNNQLIGVIPYNLPTRIEILNLERNHLHRTIPWSLGQLVSLTELRLAHNNLTGPITDTFSRLGSLITLDLADNAFTGGIPRTLGKLSQLSFLSLQGNAIDAGLDVLTNLRSLQAVDIRDNAFHGERIPSLLWTIPNFHFSAREFNLSLPNSPAPSQFPGSAPPITSPPETYNLSVPNSPAPSQFPGSAQPIVYPPETYNLSPLNSPAPSPFQESAQQIAHPPETYNLSLLNSSAPSPFLGSVEPITSPPASSTGVLQANPPYLISGTDIKDPESFPFWYPERIAGISVVSVLVMVALVLILLIFNWRHKEKEYNRGDSEMS